ncbi:hypothetical protein [Nostoc sp.]
MSTMVTERLALTCAEQSRGSVVVPLRGSKLRVASRREGSRSAGYAYAIP